MSNFIITTDTGANLSKYFIDKYDPQTIKIPVFLNDTPHIETDSTKTFYQEMKAGKIATTSQTNVTEICEFFEKFLQQGLDIIHISLSSGISGLFDNCRAAIEILCEKYPNQKICVVDSLCASAGQGAMYISARKLQEDKKTYAEISTWLEANKYNMIHLFTVDSLFYLQRGGRISRTTAVIGAALGVKPLMCVDDAGKLVLCSKIRGRRRSLDEMIDWTGRLLSDQKPEMIFVAHAACPNDAEYFAKQVKKRYRCDVYTTEITPVIGAHSGPGTLHIAFWGIARPKAN